MEEIKKLRAKIKKRQGQLEAAKLAFDLDTIEWLKEEIYQLQSDLATLEADGAE